MRCINLVLVACVFAPIPHSYAQQPLPVQPEARVRVTAPRCGLDEHSATLAPMRGDTVLLVSENSTVECLAANVTRLEVSQGRKSSGTLRFALYGAPMGAMIGALGFRRECGSYEAGFPCPEGEEGEYRLWAVAGGAVVGAAVGAVLGTLIKTDDWEEVPLNQLGVSMAPRGHGTYSLGLSLRF